MDNGTSGFFFGIIIGLCMIGLAYNISGGKAIDDYRSKALRECQKDLPRNQTCVLIAVPNKGENK